MSSKRIPFICMKMLSVSEFQLITLKWSIKFVMHDVYVDIANCAYLITLMTIDLIEKLFTAELAFEMNFHA